MCSANYSFSYDTKSTRNSVLDQTPLWYLDDRIIWAIWNNNQSRINNMSTKIILIPVIFRLIYLRFCYLSLILNWICNALVTVSYALNPMLVYLWRAAYPKPVGPWLLGRCRRGPLAGNHVPLEVWQGSGFPLSWDLSGSEWEEHNYKEKQKCQ